MARLQRSSGVRHERMTDFDGMCSPFDQPGTTDANAASVLPYQVRKPRNAMSGQRVMPAGGK